MKRTVLRTLGMKLLFVVIVAGGFCAMAPAADAGPAITAPRLNQRIGSDVYTIRWQAAKGARSYILRVREKGQSAYWVNTPLTVTSYNLNLLSLNARGRKFEVFVYSCAGSNGTSCGDPSTVEAYVLGKPVTLSTPADNASSPNRKPTFTWQAYDGFYPSSGGGALTYKIAFSGNGASPQFFTTSSTTFTPPQDINPAFQNPVRWSVTACVTYNCSSGVTPRRINLGGSSFNELTGTISYSSPANGTAVDTGSQLKWATKEGVANYTVCLNFLNSGCRLTINQAAQSGSIQAYTLTAEVLNAKPPFGDYYFRGKTMYWGITGCTAGNTSCVNTGPTRRYVQVAAASTSGTGTGTGSTPQVSFAQHLYPTIASIQCDTCHQSSSTNPPYYPQKTTGAPANCTPATIPFNTTITASAMLSRLKCLPARSTQGVYANALNKIYVVPGSYSQSGLHWKAQASSAPIFSSTKTIGGQTKQLKEWIRLWIEQGANP